MQLGILHWRQVLSWLISILMDSWMQTAVCLSLLETAIARHLQQSLGWDAMPVIFVARQFCTEIPSGPTVPPLRIF